MEDFPRDQHSLNISWVAFETLKTLLAAPADGLDDAIDQSIARLGTGFNLCHVFVRLPCDTRLGNACHDWMAPRASSSLRAVAGLDIEDMPSWRERFEAGEPLHVSDVAGLSDTLHEKHLFETLGFAALLVAPIRQGGELTGILGFAVTNAPREFSPDEIESVQTLTAAIASVMHRTRRSEDLERVNACLKATLGAIPDLVLELDPDARFLKYQFGRSMTRLPIIERLNGFLPEEALPPEGAAIVRAVIADVDATGNSEGRTFYYDLPGERRWYQISAAAHDEGGYVLVVQDITTQRAHLRELEWLGDVARRTSNLVVVSDVEGRIEWVNPAFEAISGWTQDEVRGHTPGSFLHCDLTDPDTVARIDRAMHAREAIDTEILNRSRSGKDFWLKLQIEPRFDGKGRHIGFIAVETDVTDLIEARSAASAAEQRSKASREQLVSAVEAAARQTG